MVPLTDSTDAVTLCAPGTTAASSSVSRSCTTSRSAVGRAALLAAASTADWETSLATRTNAN